jgi:hypothetical protein
VEHGDRGRHREVATHLEAEVVALELEFLNVAFGQEGQELVELIVVELHDDQFSRPR